MITTFVPYAPDKNLVIEYNRCMRMVPDSKWACFLDHDAMFTTYDWHNQMLEYIKKYPNYQCFVVKTNRCGGEKQKRAISGDDIRDHRDYARRIESDKGLIDFTKPAPYHFSAVCFLLKKSAWKTIGGFKSWNDKNNVLGVDSRLHQDLFEHGFKIGIMEGIYVYHWYSGGGKRDVSHLL